MSYSFVGTPRLSITNEKTTSVSDKITDFLIDPTRIHNMISPETRSLMSQMLEFAEESISQAAPKPPTPIREKLTPQFNPSTPSTGPAPSVFSTPISSTISSLIAVMGRLMEELEGNLIKLLSLNPSRRETIVQYLERLSGIHTQNHSSPSLRTNSRLQDSTFQLKKWIEGPRSSTQTAALKTYLEEVALIALGQALILKAWSDRGLRTWSVTDLGKLNWVLSSALKPYVPLDREGWQITRPNLYSWYNPSALLQNEIWNALESWRITNEGPHFLMRLLIPIRKSQPEVYEPAGYDFRFFKALWDSMGNFGFSSNPEGDVLKRNKIIFSPTLRDGTMVRSAPASLTWIGLENSPFQLMLAELLQIWWGPLPPPLWSIGSGLEVHTRDQLALALGSPKVSAISKIAEMEACDVALVLEEQVIRTQGRNAHSARFRELIEGLPYFKKLKTSGTSLGNLQACVALTKLRPGGLLWWARQEPLSSKDGCETLNFLLERAKLCFEWDFSQIEHTLPVGTPLFPGHLYLFKKEINLENRLSHRPIRHTIRGYLRSHIELPLILEDSFTAAHASNPLPRGQWSIHSHSSPTCQREWLEKWPDPTSQTTLIEMDQLRGASVPLAHFTTIRPTPDGDQKGEWSVHLSLKGFWLTAEQDSTGRRLVSRPLPRPGHEAQGSGYLVLVSDDAWITPLSAYLTSNLVRNWLDHNAERRGEKWVLNEQLIKWIPMTKSFLRALGIPLTAESGLRSEHLQSLGGYWESLASEVAHAPKKVQAALVSLSTDESGLFIHASIFVRTARALEYIQSGQSRLFSMIHTDGSVNWKELLGILPKNECVTVSIHPRIRLSGSLPPHLPISRMEKVKVPSPGVLLSTESGFSLHIGADSSLLLSMIQDQLQGVEHPTWNELLQYLKLPRRVELAESTALEVLRSHTEQHDRLDELKNLLSSCKLY